MLPLHDVHEFEIEVNAECLREQHDSATGRTRRYVIAINRHLVACPPLASVIPSPPPPPARPPERQPRLPSFLPLPWGHVTPAGRHYIQTRFLYRNPSWRRTFVFADSGPARPPPSLHTDFLLPRTAVVESRCIAPKWNEIFSREINFFRSPPRETRNLENKRK